jgi:hypothetical protein
LGLKTGKASAADRIAEFNAQQRTGANAANFNYNATRANQLAANANQQEIYNKGLIQQQYQNQFQKAGGVNQAAGGLAGNLQAQAGAAQQAQQAQTGAILNLAGTVGGAMIGGPAGAAVGGQVAKSGFGGQAPANSYDDFYMNKLGK